jgi:RimJ/RimL family protein N-acetyltransferase
VAEAPIEFVRLVEVPVAAVADLLNEPRNARHMPLSHEFSLESAAAWVEAKDGQWTTNGYGPWAVLVAGTFAGWGGFQCEEGGADFALVLRPAYWGHGEAVTRAALDRGFGELGLESVLIALPYTRDPERVVRRFGFVPDGEVSYGQAAFRQYRLTRDGWQRARQGSPEATPR